MRALVVLALAGCWTNDARPTAPAEPVVHYDFHAVEAGIDHGWRATIVGDAFTLVHDGRTQHGVLAHGPRALDFRDADGSVLLACRRVPVDVHPAGAELSLACDPDARDGTPAWSAPSEPVDAWSCLSDYRAYEIVFIEDTPVEAMILGCCEADDCRYQYVGYRKRR
jgi:hypothetical protein